MPASDNDISSFRDLRVWQAAMDVAEQILAACEEEPISQRFRLAGQLEAAAASVPANIAERHASGSTKNYIKHLYIARGSLAETLTFLELFGRRKYIARQRADLLLAALEPVARMLNALINSLSSKKLKGRKSSPQAPSPKP